MKLAYRVVEPEGGTAHASHAEAVAGESTAVLLHGQGGVPVDQMVAFARRVGLAGTVVVPFGDYATTPSGMEVGGPCWYRSLPGGAGTDPLTMTRAVVQVSDLLDDAGLGRPVLVGWRQGGAVAVGVGLLAPSGVRAVVAVDAPAAHLGRAAGGPLRPRTEWQRPSSWWRRGRPTTWTMRPRPRSSVGGAGGRAVAAAPGDGRPAADDGENEKVVADVVARFVGAATDRSAAEGNAR